MMVKYKGSLFDISLCVLNNVNVVFWMLRTETTRMQNIFLVIVYWTLEEMKISVDNIGFVDNRKLRENAMTMCWCFCLVRCVEDVGSGLFLDIDTSYNYAKLFLLTLTKLKKGLTTGYPPCAWKFKVRERGVKYSSYISTNIKLTCELWSMKSVKNALKFIF